MDAIPQYRGRGSRAAIDHGPAMIPMQTTRPADRIERDDGAAMRHRRDGDAALSPMHHRCDDATR
jgi:hypothetical protein